MLQSFSRFFKTEAKKEEKVFRNNLHITSQSFVNYQLDSSYNFNTDHINNKEKVDFKNNLFNDIKKLGLKDISSNYHDNDSKYVGYGGFGLFLTQRFSVQLMPFLNMEVQSVTDKTTSAEVRRIRLNNFASKYLSNIGVDLHTDLTTNRGINLGIGLIYRMDNNYINRIEIGMNTPVYNAFRLNITDNSKVGYNHQVAPIVKEALDSVKENPNTPGEFDQFNDKDSLDLRYYLIGGIKPSGYDRKKTRDLLTKDQWNEAREKILNDHRFKDLRPIEKLALQSACVNLFKRGINNLRRFFFIQIVSQNFNITSRIRLNLNLILGGVLGIGFEINLKNHVLF